MSAYTVRLARRLRELDPDVVHTNSLKSGFYGSIAARLSGRPVIWHLRDRVADDYLPPRAVAVTRFALRHLPDLVLCNSQETLGTAHVARKAAAVVASPVVHDPYEAVEAVARQARIPVIGMVGRLSPWKGQHVFLRAFAKLTSDHPELTARIVGSTMFGEDAYRDELKSLVTQLGIDDRVTFVGFTDEVERELAGMDILVHASTVPEPFGQVIVEGMAAGLAVIATAAGGPLEIVTPEVDGLVVAQGDVDELADALKRLVDDAALRKRLGDAAMSRAADFRPEIVGRAVDQIYRQVLSPRSR
jgi:glycosyltransferase involved in cell wall biosynthesis